MRSLVVAAAVVLLALICSTAWAGVAYSGPGFVPLAGPPVKVVYHYWPTAPVYAAPVVAVPTPAVAVPVYPVYPAPAVIRAKVHYGQPTRVKVRTALP